MLTSVNTCVKPSELCCGIGLITRLLWVLSNSIVQNTTRPWHVMGYWPPSKSTDGWEKTAYPGISAEG